MRKLKKKCQDAGLCELQRTDKSWEFVEELGHSEKENPVGKGQGVGPGERWWRAVISSQTQAHCTAHATLLALVPRQTLPWLQTCYDF